MWLPPGAARIPSVWATPLHYPRVLGPVGVTEGGPVGEGDLLPDQDVDLFGWIDTDQTFLRQFDVSNLPAGKAELEL